MTRKFLSVTGMAIIFLLPALARSDVDAQLDRWWGKVENFGSGMDFNAGGIYQGQTAMYATAGGMDWRYRSGDFSVGINVQPPRISAGCGGIDMYLGGISATNADQFIDSLEAIARDGTSLMFLLALQVVSPMLGDVVEDIRKFAQDYLNLNYNSCDVAKGIIGGAHAMMSADQQNCITQRMENDSSEDYSDAAYACSTQAAGEVFEPRQAFTHGNLFWYAVMQNPNSMFRQDPQFAQLIMNLVGTVIYSTAPNAEGDDSPKAKVVHILPPQVAMNGVTPTGQTILDLILYGSEWVEQMYPEEELAFCDDLGMNPSDSTAPDRCMSVTYMSNLQMGITGLEDRVREQVGEVVRKIYDDEVLTSSEQWLVASSRIPLYKYLTVAAAAMPFASGNNGAGDKGQFTLDMIDEYAESLAKDIAIAGLIDAVDQTRRSVGKLPYGISTTKEVETYRDQLDVTLMGLKALDREYAMDAEKYFRFYDQMRQFERMVISRMAHMVTASAMWGG